MVLTEEAQRQARSENRWWREHRDAKRLFSDELRAAKRTLAAGPKLEIYGYFDGLAVRRLLLEKTRCHVYFLLVEEADLVRIIAVWGATRGVDPGLR